HRKLALFRVPYALRATFIPSLRFGTGYASPYNPCHCLKLKNSKLNLLIFKLYFIFKLHLYKKQNITDFIVYFLKMLAYFCKKIYIFCIFMQIMTKRGLLWQMTK
ncbi:MAG: hypothetical protein PUJ82_07805, partial [Spirochaetales bacterium]|nr:hypothetical protein [Spirochaetales bacterium]